MPYQRNPFFTGREDVLLHLHDVLAQGQAAILSQTYAINGLGGIGKTQTAIEYAYRYFNDYSAVFWISAETLDSIISSMVAIATLLNLAEKENQDQDQIMAAVMYWLSHHGDWLLIFDNVEDPTLLKRFLPPARYGSLLFTSRRQSLGLTSQTLTLEQITAEEGFHLLLHRARLADAITSLDQLSLTNVAHAREIVSALDGLPLALDQAGAYIEATQCNLADYLQIYQKHPTQLLDTRSESADHADSVVKTVLISLKNLEQISTAAADMLRICSFLSPDAIPEEIFTQGASYLGPALSIVATDTYQLNQTFGAILNYSLLKRHAKNHTFSLHRLVQIVIQNSMEAETQQYWAELVVRLLDKVLPSSRMETWAQCQRYLPHTIAGASLIERWSMTFPAASNLLHGIAHYLHERSQYRQAEPFYQQALRIRQQGNDFEDIVKTLGNLAILYRNEGKYALAEPLFQQVISIIEQHEASTSREFVKGLNNLGMLYVDRGKYALAEPIFQQTLQLVEKLPLEDKDAHLEISLKNLAILYSQQGRYREAVAPFQRAIALNEQLYGSTHPRVALCSHYLAHVFYQQGDFRQAAALNRRAAILFKQAYGSKNRRVALTILLFANLARARGRYPLAEIFYQKAFTLFKQILGLEHPETADTFHDFALFRWMNRQKTEAVALYQQALRIREQALGTDHPKTKETQADYERLLRELRSTDETEPATDTSPIKRATLDVSNNIEMVIEPSRTGYPICPTCRQNVTVVRSGANRIGTQRFRCYLCQRYFTPHIKKRDYNPTDQAKMNA